MMRCGFAFLSMATIIRLLSCHHAISTGYCNVSGGRLVFNSKTLEHSLEKLELSRSHSTSLYVWIILIVILTGIIFTEKNTFNYVAKLIRGNRALIKINFNLDRNEDLGNWQTIKKPILPCCVLSSSKTLQKYSVPSRITKIFEVSKVVKRSRCRITMQEILLVVYFVESSFGKEYFTAGVVVIPLPSVTW